MNFLARLPQDVRRIIMQYISRRIGSLINGTYNSICKGIGPTSKMLLLPNSPFTNEIGVLFSELHVSGERHEELLIECPFFERFGKQLDEVWIFKHASDRLCT